MILCNKVRKIDSNKQVSFIRGASDSFNVGVDCGLNVLDGVHGHEFCKKKYRVENIAGQYGIVTRISFLLFCLFFRRFWFFGCGGWRVVVHEGSCLFVVEHLLAGFLFQREPVFKHLLEGCRLLCKPISPLSITCAGFKVFCDFFYN